MVKVSRYWIEWQLAEVMTGMLLCEFLAAKNVALIK